MNDIDAGGGGDTLPYCISFTHFCYNRSGRHRLFTDLASLCRCIGIIGVFGCTVVLG